MLSTTDQVRRVIKERRRTRWRIRRRPRCSARPSPKRKGGDAMNSHDVRRMRQCSECGELGILDADGFDELPALVRIGSGKGQKVSHPRCIPLSLLMVLAREELDHVRICDVDEDVMQCILTNLKYRVDYGTDSGMRKS